MNNGYVFVTNRNPNFLKLLDIAVCSVLAFSDKKIEIFGINFDYQERIDDRILVKRLNLPVENFNNICMSKLSSIINCSFDGGIYLDADTIINRETDVLFSILDRIVDLPILPEHEGSKIAVNDHNLLNLMKFFGVKHPTQPYVHADTIIFNHKCKMFFKQCIEMSDLLIKNGGQHFAGDEGIVNINLWKNKAKDCYIDLCDPNYQYFENKLGLIRGQVIDWDYFVCHGCKDIGRANRILEELKKRDGTI